MSMTVARENPASAISHRASAADADVCVLGPPIEHRDSLLSMLGDRVNSVTWVNDSHSFFRDRDLQPPGRLPRALDAFRGTSAGPYLDHLLEELDARHCQVLIAYWGTLPLADVIAIRRARPRIRIVLMLLCYPLALTRVGILRQKVALSRAWSSLDAVMCPTQEMADYLRADFGRRTRGPRILTVPPCWPDSFIPSERPAPAADRPSLVFIGRTDLGGRTVHPGDDVRPLMRGLLDAGIELHHAYSKETDDGHPLRRPFKPLPIVELIAGLAAYDACLIAYNLEAAPRRDRFDLTVPDRLLSAVAAGVPIALPREGYAASKTYLAGYPAVIEFDTPAELYERLSDRAQVAEWRDRAWRARRDYSAHTQAPRLVELIGGLVGNLAGGSAHS